MSSFKLHFLFRKNLETIQLKSIDLYSSTLHFHITRALWGGDMMSAGLESNHPEKCIFITFFPSRNVCVAPSQIVCDEQTPRSDFLWFHCDFKSNFFHSLSLICELNIDWRAFIFYSLGPKNICKWGVISIPVNSNSKT